MNLIPLFGHEPKSTRENELDETFIRDAQKATGPKERAIDSLNQQGWKLFSQGRLEDSIKRFNQIYLLDPKDYRAYWGLGAVTAQQYHFESSLKLFSRAATLHPNDSRILCDYGFAQMNYAHSLMAKHPKINAQTKVSDAFQAAESRFSQAATIDPRAALPHARMAILLFYRGDYVAASAEVHAAKFRGGEGLDPRFLSDLSARLPDPT
jgi:Flp pilus assembly protein TadD